MTKWVSGNKHINDLIKKYNVSTDKPGASNTCRRKTKVTVPSIPVWLDDRFIKTYTDYSEMMAVIEDMTRLANSEEHFIFSK